MLVADSYFLILFPPPGLAGHGKPVDVWAMGVITYFLLAGEFPLHFNVDLVS